MNLHDLAAIHAASFTRPAPWSADQIGATLAAPGAFLLVEAQGFLIGRVIADEAELLTLAVAPPARRAGIGARLVARFLTASADKGAATAFLEVAADNPAAIALYLAAGFVDAGQRRGYYRDPAGGPATDARILTRTLRPAD
ncbi:GNAT family N-acetyltransferase [Paracoccus sp. p4-l81]|uniref:GNAT family N-acetyltransferase n=1 Tax=unclassified Paracoccus (in: a-proteobacteria) TaxID=2688777 RepID=UPI0035B7CDBE